MFHKIGWLGNNSLTIFLYKSMWTCNALNRVNLALWPIIYDFVYSYGSVLSDKTIASLKPFLTTISTYGNRMCLKSVPYTHVTKCKSVPEITDPFLTPGTLFEQHWARSSWWLLYTKYTTSETVVLGIIILKINALLKTFFPKLILNQNC